MKGMYLSALLVVISVVLLVPGLVASQASEGSQAKAVAADTWTPPRTPDGHPDLQGIWDFRTITPLQRPDKLAGKEFLTKAEAVEFERETLERRNADRRDADPSRERIVNGAPATADVARAYNHFWWNYGTNLTEDKRTSLIVDPPDGKIPSLTPKAQVRSDARRSAGERAAHGPEDRGVSERCILGFNSGPPMNPSAYNNNVQLFQAPGYVVIFNEMVHNARIVPLDARPHLPLDIRQWVGDSRGRWEGESLVIETTNFTDQTNFRGSGRNMHLIERFTRVDVDTLRYEYTIDDPESFERPWSVSVPMKKADQPMFEYACHEGNYGMPSSLRGARAIEKAAIEATTQAAR